MLKRFVLIRAANLQLSFLYQFRPFQNRNLWNTSQTLFARRRSLVHPYFFMEINHFNINDNVFSSLSYILGLVVRFFKQVRFFSGPGSGSDFYVTMSRNNFYILWIYGVKLLIESGILLSKLSLKLSHNTCLRNTGINKF